MTKLKIKVTKEILEKSKYCIATGKADKGGAGFNCAVALAIRDIFPDAWIHRDTITPFSFSDNNTEAYFGGARIHLPNEAIEYIKEFDATPFGMRTSMPEIEFEVEIPDEIIERISIEELRPLLENHPTLELVN